MSSFTVGKTWRVNIKSLFAALIVSLVCLGSLHFYAKYGFVLFTIGAVGALAMSVVTGAHGDINPIGEFVYVVVNTLTFYACIRTMVQIVRRRRRNR